MRLPLKRVGLLIARVSGVEALWEEAGAQATLLLSARWLIASATGWVWYTVCVTGWPEGVLITVASDTLGAVLGTTAVGTLVMEAIVVLVKLIMDGARKQARQEAQQAREEARQAREEARQELEQAQKTIRALEKELEKRDTTDLAMSSEPTEPAK